MAIEEGYKVILSVCSIITFCMSVYFWFIPKKALSNKILAMLAFIWASILLIFVLQSKAFFNQLPHLYGLATGSMLLFFPLLFLFIKAYLDFDFKLTLFEYLHLLPVAIFAVCYSPFYFQSASVKINYINTHIPDWVATLFLWTTVVMMIQGLVYSIMSIYVLQSYSDEPGSFEVGKHKWLRQFIIFNMLLWAIGVTAFLFNSLDYDLGVDLFVVYYFGLTTMAFWVAYVSLQNPAYFTPAEVKETVDSAEVINEVEESQVFDVKEYTEDVVEFIAFFEESKPYLETQLNLQKLSHLSGFSRNHISEMLNNYIGKSFYDFINEYRVEEFIRLVDQGLYEKHTLSHLYESAGFNSKATFNRFFKKKTGLTPTNYIQKASSDV